MLYVDIPSLADLKSLAAHREDICVSIYLPTTPVSQDAAGDRIELKNLAKQALRQLEKAGADKRRVAALMEHLDDLVDDDEFWRFQARSLAVLATPDNARTFRVPNALVPIVEISDRFHLKPLLRAVAFPNTCFVLALAENAVRVIQVSADLAPAVVSVDGMPKDAASAVGRSTVNDRSPSGRLQGSEGQKVLLRQFARKVDQALRGLVTGSDVPLVLAACFHLSVGQHLRPSGQSEDRRQSRKPDRCPARGSGSCFTGQSKSGRDYAMENTVRETRERRSSYD
jgi:hypothetical protein